MSLMTIPVAVQRWFEDKEGWAFHPSLSQRMSQLLDSADSQLKADCEIVFVVPGPGGWIVGELVTDHNCLNINALTRWPRIFRVAIVPGARPDDRQTVRVLKALRSLPLPTERGPQSSLSLQVPPPPVWSPLREPRPSLFRAILGLIGFGEVLSESQRAVRLAILFEQRWGEAIDDGTLDAIRSVLAEGWCGVPSDGRFLRREDLLRFHAPSNVVAEFPSLSGKEESFDAAVLGETMLRVRCFLRLGKQKVCCLRAYCRDRRTDNWSMATASVTRVAEVVAVPVSFPVVEHVKNQQPAVEDVAEVLPADRSMRDGVPHS